jgi:hypothetical protein
VKVNLKAYRDQSSNNRAAKKSKFNPNEAGTSQEDEILQTIKYVVTNPDKDTRLEKSDLVFVLARSDPGDPELWDDYDNKNQDVYEMMISSKNMDNRKKGKD